VPSGKKPRSITEVARNVEGLGDCVVFSLTSQKLKLSKPKKKKPKKKKEKQEKKRKKEKKKNEGKKKRTKGLYAVFGSDNPQNLGHATHCTLSRPYSSNACHNQ
jgi:hypothetical protein